MAPTKSKKHFVGLTWSVNDGKGNETKGGFAMQCDKNESRVAFSRAWKALPARRSATQKAMTVKN
jgi:hypothetical protein